MHEQIEHTVALHMASLSKLNQDYETQVNNLMSRQQEQFKTIIKMNEHRS